MRLIVYFAVLFILVAVAQTACNSSDRTVSKSPVSPATTAPNDGVRRITTGELKDLLASDQAVVIDVRNEAAYKQSHIKGAKLIPAPEVLNHINELPRNKLIVTYCS